MARAERKESNGTALDSRIVYTLEGSFRSLSHLYV